MGEKSTDDIRTIYAYSREEYEGGEAKDYFEAFDAWLKQVKAEAWDEGYEDGQRPFLKHVGDNPYREQEKFLKDLPELTPEQIRKAAAADAPPYRPRENYLKDLRD